MVPLSEIARVLNEDGYGLVGAPSQVWRNGLSESMDALHNAGKFRILSVQHTELDEHSCLYYMALVRGV